MYNSFHFKKLPQSKTGSLSEVNWTHGDCIGPGLPASSRLLHSLLQVHDMNQAVSPSKSSSPQPSPGSWDVDRGRSRTRRPSVPQSELTGSRRHKCVISILVAGLSIRQVHLLLRLRGYHALLSSFGKVFHVEKRWKLIREMGSGAYGVVMYVSGIAISWNYKMDK
jgi:hypothetical protein